MILSSSNSRSAVKMGSSSGYPGYASPGVPGLGIPPPDPNLTEYRNTQQQQYLMSHHMQSLPTPQPQPLGKFETCLKHTKIVYLLYCTYLIFLLTVTTVTYSV